MRSILLKNKKGMQLSVEMILLLVLTVSAVVILSVFFSKTSNRFFGKLGAYFIHPNVDSIIEACNVLSSTDSSYAFCCDKKDVKYYEVDESGNQIKLSGDFTCGELIEKDFINNKITKLNCEGVSC